MPSEPSARARVHLAPSKCYWPRRIPAPLALTRSSPRPCSRRGDEHHLRVPPRVPQWGAWGCGVTLGATGSGGGQRGQGPVPPPHRAGCYMTRRGRRWAGTHRGCDSCCGYNREPRAGGDVTVCAASRLPTLFSWGGHARRVGAKHPGTAIARRPARKNTRHPQKRPAPQAGTSREGCWGACVPPKQGEGRGGGQAGCSPPAPARRGGGTKLAPRKAAKFSPFPCEL